MKLRLTYLIIALAGVAMTVAAASPGSAAAKLGRPDLERIKAETTDENSQYYYPKLLKEFMRNDTTMTDQEFQHFYYGTLFQEDYDPYRGDVHPEELQAVLPLYSKNKLTRAERQRMLSYADAAIADNPVNLRQITNRIYVYQQNGKYDLAKIWQYKLNHLLLVIAASGNGTLGDNAWTVVYPQHEYDFLNLSGHIATGQKFEPPYYDFITINPKKDSDPKGYYFNIRQMLEQYYSKHPSETADNADDVEQAAAAAAEGEPQAGNDAAD